ncbi:hypothetical protein [Massilia oculi]|uniref:hypothetical protein n=1 Tax=Massilia oculi TaxID=945844 RepID=UPI0028AA876D|nr:hypothetical protein [Massilia oculi]
MRKRIETVASSSGRKIEWINGALITLLILLPTIFGWIGKTAEMGILIVACSIALCFANLSKMQSFKGAGFEAQMREAVQEAYTTLDALQNLARPLLRTNIANVAFGSRWDGIGKEKEHELMRDLSDLATSLEMDQDVEITSMKREFYNLYAVDHLRFILQVLQSARIKNETVTGNMQGLMVRSHEYVPPTGAVVWSALSDLSAMQKRIVEPYVLDYEHYIQSHTFRRREAIESESLPDLNKIQTELSQ